MSDIKAIPFADCALGIEFGSTRIKLVLADADCRPVASGDCTWASRFENGVWTYPLDEVWSCLRTAYAALAADCEARFGGRPSSFGAVGVSGMMHGYLPFGADGELLVPFRTWQNTCTGEASARLTEALSFNIPQRWSAAHLYQAILNGETHVRNISFLTTLAGYVHWRLTGRKCVGIGEASGMFPVSGGDYNEDMLERFGGLIAGQRLPWKPWDILPPVLPAGAGAGSLTPEGARLLDPTGALEPGVPFCPPEGDAGTGMTATNAVLPRTGNVSAGTSVFSMVVLERPLKSVHPELDVVATPDGHDVAMVHCNNCTSDLNAWAGVLREAASLFGAEPETGELFTRLYEKSLEGSADCGGLVAYNLLAGEPVLGLSAGRPMLLREPGSRFTLANLMRAQLYSAFAALKLGMDRLSDENVKIDSLTGHGGMFKTPGVAQRYLAAAVNSPVSVLETAGEGGPFGMALLARYMLDAAPGETLGAYLENRVFRNCARTTLSPDPADAAGFRAFLTAYQKYLPSEKTAAETN